MGTIFFLFFLFLAVYIRALSVCCVLFHVLCGKDTLWLKRDMERDMELLTGVGMGSWRVEAAAGDVLFC